MYNKTMKRVEVRESKLNKVPVYTKCLEDAIVRSKEVGLENSLKEWGEKIKKRRLEWFNKNKDKFKLEGTEVRKGFQFLLFKYMGIKPEEVPVVEETETKITWRAYDFCPYLEAMKKLGLDSRIVCKHANDASVQALLDAFNPKLRFSRNYTKIRPYTEYCEETIELVN
jgi:hypothetical protein